MTPQPDKTLALARTLVDRWIADDLEEGRRPHAVEGTRLRHSLAGHCPRRLGLYVAGFPESDPMDEAGTWVINIGRLIHDKWQAATVDKWESDRTTVRTEVACQVDGLDASGAADLVVDERQDDGSNFRVLVELKTTGGFSFKRAVGVGGAGEGPRDSAVKQAALNGLALGADRAVVVLLALEAVSVGVGRKNGLSGVGRFAAEWTLDRQQIVQVGRAEAARFQSVLAQVDSGRLPAGQAAGVPDGGAVVDPLRGRWEQVVDGQVAESGRTWECDYCPFQSSCAEASL